MKNLNEENIALVAGGNSVLEDALESLNDMLERIRKMTGME